MKSGTNNIVFFGCARLSATTSAPLRCPSSRKATIARWRPSEGKKRGLFGDRAATAGRFVFLQAPRTFGKLGLPPAESASAVLPALQAHRAKRVPLVDEVAA